MKSILVLVSILFITGCAFTVHDVNVDYKYDKPQQFSFVPKTLDVGGISDARGVENPRLIMNMTNLYGDTTSGGWQAEKPLNEIVKDAVVQGLSKSNIILIPNPELKLSGELLSFEVKTIMGAWQGSFKGKMTAKFQLVDPRSGDIIWRDTFIGSSQVKSSDGVVGTLRATIDDLIDKLLSDDYFQQKIKK